MRLIDAEELKEQLSWCEVVRLSIKEINQIIDDIPTVECQNAIRWTDKVFLTSNGEITTFDGFCPNCGAYMKGGTNAEDDLHHPGP